MGKTIIISSHILPELSDLCNMVGIIEQGELKYAGPVSDLMQRASQGLVVHIAVDDRIEQAAAILGQVKGITRVEISANGASDGLPRIHVTIDQQSGLPVSELPAQLITNGFRISEIKQEPVNLETAFMRLTKGLVS